MLGWIWVYEDGSTGYRIKTEIGGRFFYLSLKFSSDSLPSTYDIDTIFPRGKIAYNISSAVERWRDNTGLIRKDYIDFKPGTFLRILLVTQETETREERSKILKSIGRMQNNFPLKVFIYKYDFIFKIFNVLIDCKKILPGRDRHKREPRNLLEWLKRGKESIITPPSYSSLPIIYYSNKYTLLDIIWFLIDMRKWNELESILRIYD